MVVMLWLHMTYRALLFVSLFVGFHLVRRGVPDGIPRLGYRASGMHGRSVHIIPMMRLFVMVLMFLFLDRFIMTVHRTFYLLLCLRQAHAAIRGFTDSR